MGTLPLNLALGDQHQQPQVRAKLCHPTSRAQKGFLVWCLSPSGSVIYQISLQKPLPSSLFWGCSYTGVRSDSGHVATAQKETEKKENGILGNAAALPKPTESPTQSCLCPADIALPALISL